MKNTVYKSGKITRLTRWYTSARRQDHQSMLRHHTKLFFHRHAVDLPLTARAFTSPSVRWFRDARIYCIPVRTIPSRPRDVPQPHANSKDLRRWKLQFKEQEERARLLSIQTKREQWKAASARYYEKHPEVKERKRVIMAEKRAAKKLARRRCDPPKQPKPTPNVGLNTASAAALASAPSSENEIMLAHEEASAAESLLFLQQSTKWNPFPPDLPDSDDPGTSTNSEASSPGR
ncbi:hypothetical protein B0H13DRAFT_1862210 [Mycena leptocephala]|nr:hypothetical protein B0H13DRAFT_1891927 [Mycena leptocephala]KAJ7926579.1 hypothetical protein B0H13DRAFT_1862210 [Mycena leptocephala]